MSEARKKMVEHQLVARGISDARVLAAFESVPREHFMPDALAEFAYQDSPLPIAAGQTISQPYIVALTAEALALRGDERVLEIGTGSGYAAAILSRLAREVFTVERLPELAQGSSEVLSRNGYHNVHVRQGDGTLGWQEHAPYQAIAVAAGGPNVPPALLAQLAPGGRLVMPVASATEGQELVRLTRKANGSVITESLGGVRFVPLIGEQGWSESTAGERPSALAERGRARPSRRTVSHHGPDHALSALIRECAEPLADDKAVDALIERIGSARVVLLGESTHGTSEFYRMRARVSRALMERAGFDFVAVEADWPDAMRINHHVTGRFGQPLRDFVPFSRFPTWMWRNEEVHEFVGWLKGHNQKQRTPARRAGFFGLDLYSMFSSIAHVLDYLDRVDPEAAAAARARYGGLTPWQSDPAAYGRAVLSGRYASAEGAVVAMLRELMKRRLEYNQRDGEHFFDAAQNAHVVANAERYYRAMYYGSAASWNLRDSHMFETLKALLAFHGPDARGIVWAHNSHVGNARATEMSVRDELNIGQLCREAMGDDVYIVGFGTNHGTVAAAPNWDEPMERMRVRPALPQSYERLCHDSRVPAFALHLREPHRQALRDELLEPRLERAIGVVYRPETERASHYFHASLPAQFDEYLWFDETESVTPLGIGRGSSHELPDTYPFGL